MIGPEHERPAAPTGPAFTDAVTFAWADPRSEVCGLARIGIAPGGASALAVLFADRAPVAALARGGDEPAGPPDWQAISVAGLRAGIDEPLRRWRVACDFGDGSSFALAFGAVGVPAAAGVAGMSGYEQLCTVGGTVTTAGAERTVQCLGQRGHAWGEPDWSGLELTRTVGAWLEDGTALTLATARPAGAVAHAHEQATCALLGADAPVDVVEPRLSTTYDGEGRQIRAGLELWVREEDDYPQRGTGRAVCGSTLELGQLRLDCAFFEWTLDGSTGLGRYDILRRA